jgi:trafficking protein particle complex subunit 11
VVILVGESGTDTPFDVDERLGSIRRATGLDSKHLFFIQPESSEEAAVDFAKSILTPLQPFCVEHYRDLSKHTRRKRNRTSVPAPTVPPTSGTSQTLPLQGWNVRYEFKLGVFAEFRQEMDAACRNYESAYEGLFSHELFETISSWSPRFNEARLLADTIAIRILRCLLWSAQPTNAARFWSRHRHRVKDLVNRRGKGSDNYGWEAWEAVWSKSFAQMLYGYRRSEEPRSESAGSLQVRSQFLPPEKSIPMGERILPWELLHHDGYWSNKAWKHTCRRRQLAHQMPEEDRTSPGQSPASAIANRSHLYDAYLALEPHLEYPLGGKKGYNYSREILNTVRSTTHSFSTYHQNRFVEQLHLEEAKEHLRVERWHEALEVLRSIWPCLSWRQAGWWKMVREAALAFREAARQTGDTESLLRLEWEAHSSTISLGSDWKHNLHHCLDGIQAPSTKPSLVIKSEEALSPLWASLHFATTEGNVGEPLKTQLVVVSTAYRESEPIALSEIKAVFEGGLRPIRILPSDSEALKQDLPALLSQVRLRESSSSPGDSAAHAPTSGQNPLEGMADIMIHPGQRKVYEITCIPREAGDVKVSSIKLLFENNAFSLAYVVKQQITLDAKWWSLQGTQLQSRHLGRARDASTVIILPKPPKLSFELPNLKQRYYTNESIALAVVIRNEEVEPAEVSIKAKLTSPVRHEAKIQWEGGAESDQFGVESSDKDVPSKGFLSLAQRSAGSIGSGESHSVTFLMNRTSDATKHELELTVNYHLRGDPETLLTKTTTADLRISRPFEANYEFLPRLDPKPWPSFFDPQSASEGLSQRFLLVSKIASFATEPVVIEGVDLSYQNVLGNAICNIEGEETRNQDNAPSDGIDAVRTIPPEGVRESSFELFVRKNALGDPHSVALDLVLVVRWRRNPEDDLLLSMLDVPRYVIPMAEPRVLLSKSGETLKNHPGLVHLQYTIENPSMHYLTFNLTMESSDESAFSGPKAMSVSLVPVSRSTVDYRILAHQGAKWVRISLAVVDAYFNKALRIIPAGEGISSDGKRGLLVWVE